jgi:2-polyprenyl-3-methyl-5-hydroxy-6-metoxy-1,4-benzoquinol methylase
VHRLLSSWVVVVASLCLVLLGCSRKESARQEDAPKTARSAVAATAVGSMVESVSSTAHDPAHPPIDCPLRKQGLDPAHMRPFEEVDKYIQFLERSDRAVWQKPDEVVQALGLRGNEVVFDLGAGSGYFSFRFAAALPAGKVIAADTEGEMIRHIHHRAMTEGVQNVEVKLIKPSDPEVDASADLVFICDVLHHVTDRPSWLRKLASGMKSGARLVLIEFKEGKLPEGPPEGAKIPRAELVSLATGARLVLAKEHEGLLPYQVFLEFRKP